MEVQVLLCRRVLWRLPEIRDDDSIAFLRSWLSANETKAVVLLNDWSAFVKDWETTIGDSPEVKGPFFAIIRGIVTPYRDKYADEAGIPPDGETVAEEDEVRAMAIITRRHYATCKYLVTDEPAVFQGKDLRLPDERILTPDLFRATQQTFDDGTGPRSSLGP